MDLLPSPDLCLLATMLSQSWEKLAFSRFNPMLTLWISWSGRNWEVKSRFLWDRVSSLISQVWFSSPGTQQGCTQTCPWCMGSGGYKSLAQLPVLNFCLAIGSFMSKICQSSQQGKGQPSQEESWDSKSVSSFNSIYIWDLTHRLFIEDYNLKTLNQKWKCCFSLGRSMYIKYLGKHAWCHYGLKLDIILWWKTLSLKFFKAGVSLKVLINIW